MLANGFAVSLAATCSMTLIMEDIMSINTSISTNTQSINPPLTSDKLTKILQATELLSNAKDSISTLNDLAEVSQDLSSILNKLDLLRIEEELWLENNQPYTIKYTKVAKPVEGKLNLCCIGMQWKDNPGPALSAVENSCKLTAKAYNELSNGKFSFNITSQNIPVNQLHSAKNIDAAEKEARDKANATRKAGTNPYDLFAIVHNKAKGFSNANGNTAHLYGTLARDFMHEIGHLRPFRLGHAGVYYPETNTTKAYHDESSFMGRFNSHKLNAPQLYNLGWLAEKKVALFDVKDKNAEFKFEALFSKEANDSVKAVLIKRENANPLMVSFIPSYDKTLKKTVNTFALHVAQGGTTTRQALFGQKTELSDISFDRTSADQNNPTLKIKRK